MKPKHPHCTEKICTNAERCMIAPCVMEYARTLNGFHVVNVRYPEPPKESRPKIEKGYIMPNFNYPRPMKHQTKTV